MSVPVIDLFAGPGGLGEGLSRAKPVDFRIVVSIEKDGMAHETLRLRAAHRALQRCPETSPATWATWDRLIASEPWNVVFDKLNESGDELIHAACKEARAEAWNVELGPDQREKISERVHERLRPYLVNGSLPDNTVLIGGPPCQAYSLVGRARNRGKEGYRAEDDHRHFLYLEYLHVIAEFRPAIFLMENVKGILTSTVEGQQIFGTIMSDLRRPDLVGGTDTGLEYVLVPLSGSTGDDLFPNPKAEDFILRAETLGIPQARHRVIICGVRKDVFDKAGHSIRSLDATEPLTVDDVISGLPALRPALSRRGNGWHWRESFSLPMWNEALRELRTRHGERGGWVASAMERALIRIQSETDHGCGDERTPTNAYPRPRTRADWYLDRPLTLLANHESRSHMPEDLVRYLFVAAFGKTLGTSPRLADFPACLLPNHKNVDPENIGAAIFKDRFRVQLADTHSMTVTSHIAKDGHAFIHPDPVQCRSLTVREAARLQTFPDSYVFLGNRTSQYTQVGNAVPPLLAYKIGTVVGEVLRKAEMT